MPACAWRGLLFNYVSLWRHIRPSLPPSVDRKRLRPRRPRQECQREREAPPTGHRFCRRGTMVWWREKRTARTAHGGPNLVRDSGEVENQYWKRNPREFASPIAEVHSRRQTYRFVGRCQRGHRSPSRCDGGPYVKYGQLNTESQSVRCFKRGYEDRCSPPWPAVPVRPPPRHRSGSLTHPSE